MARTALITGASSGIGMEFAGVFAREGYDLVLVARDEGKLAQVRDALVKAYGVTITFLSYDLGVVGTPEALVDALAQQGMTVDVLVNNAGVGTFGKFVETDVAKLRAMLRINIIVPTLLARLIGAGMAERGNGAILNVSSLAGFMPGPWMAGYYASKAYLLSFSEALATELAGSGVTVTALCPGPTATRFFREAGAEGSGLVKGKRLLSAQRVAEYGYRAMRRGKRVAVYGLRARLVPPFLRLLPRGWVTAALWRYQAPR